MRSELLDRRLGPFENLATNPKLKRCVAGSTVFKRNLATNPIFARAVSGPDVVRRNLCTNPVPTELNTVGYGFSAPGWSVIDSDQPLLPSTFVGYEDWTPPQYAHLTYSVSGLIVGATYTASLWAIAGVLGMQMRVSPASNLSGANTATTSVGVVNELVRYKITFVATATTIYVGLFSTSVSPGSGVVGMTGILVEQRPTVLPYFDGDTPDALGFTYEWEGTAGASTSVIKTASVEVRKNHAPMPLLLTSGGGSPNIYYSFGGQNRVVSSDTKYGPGSFYAYRLSESGGIGGTIFDGFIPVVAGEAWTLSVYVKPDIADQVRLNIAWLSGTNFPADTVALSQGTYTAASGGSWTRISVSGIAPSGASLLAFQFTSQSTSYAVDTGIKLSGYLAEKTSVVLPYFDGSQTPDADLMPAWTGTPNASASILRGSSLSSWRGSDYNTVTYRSPRGGLVPSPSSASPSTAVAIAGGLSSLAGAGVTFIPGRSYTVKARIAVDEVIQGATSMARELWFGHSSTPVGEGYEYVRSAQAPNVVGEYDLELSATLGPNDIWAQVRIYHGGTKGDGKIRVLSFAIIENGAYSGPIFHGDTDPDDTGIVYEWEGAEHDSSSVMKVGVVEARRNLCLDPLGATGTNWEGGSGATISSIPGIPFPTAWSVTINNPLVNARLGPRFSTIVGRSYVASAWIYVESALWSARIATVGVAPIQLGPSLAAGWQWVSIPFVATDTSHTLLIRHNADETGNQVIAMTGVIVEERTVAHVASDRFDGYTSPDGDLSAAWTGTENASASVLYGADIQGLVAANASVTVRSLAGLGARCIPLVEDGVSSFTRVNFSAVVGRTYTAMVICRLTAPLTDADNGQTLRFTIRPASSGSMTAQSPQAPNEVGDHLLTVTFVADYSNMSMRMQHRGAPGSGSIYWDEILIVEGVYTGPYFDGDDERVVWRGTPHASTSAGYPIPV